MDSREGATVAGKGRAPDLSRMWDQPRMRDEFQVTIETVYEWRTNTSRMVEWHLAALGLLGEDRWAGLTPKQFRKLAKAEREAIGEAAARWLGKPVHELTRDEWARVERERGVPRLRLPANALPLPEVFISNKPLWPHEVMDPWGRQTGRRSREGAAQRLKPPGRPAGVRETRPRQRRAPALEVAEVTPAAPAA